MITAEHVWKYYHNRVILRDISLEIQTGAALCLTAPSGSGKTTLFRILCGLERPDSGTIKITPPRPRWSVVFQEDRLLDSLDAEKNLKFALGGDYDAEKSANLLNALGLGLSDIKIKKAREYSGGMRRRLALARALLSPSDILALDEPFTGLDMTSRRDCLNAIRRYRENRTLILISHDKQDAAALDADLFKLPINPS